MKVTMKKILFYSLLSMLVFSACQKEMTAPEPPIAFQWPQGTSDFAPYTIGSSFMYEYTSISPAVNDSFTLTVTKDTTINNLKYYKLTSSRPELSPSYFVNYNNGNITEITYNLNFLGFITVDSISENTLKENNTVNTTWNDDDVNLLYATTVGPIPVNVNFMHTLLQKNFVKEVLTKSYPNTIAVKEIVNINLPPGFPFPSGAPSSIQYDNFYAKEVGLVQRNTSIGTTQKLKYSNVIKL
jgi:hypothetical protein